MTVCYREQSWGVRITIAGTLPPEQVQLIVEDVCSKLEALDRSPWLARLLAD